MQKSFTDRVLAGVCGGLAAALHLNVWLVRLLFVILTVVSLGAFAVLYLFLWWVVPQESFVAPRRRRQRFPVLFVLLFIGLTVAAWLGREYGYLRTPTGADLFWPAALVFLSLTLFLRQVRA